MASIVPEVRIVENREFPNYSVTLDWMLLDNGALDDSKALASAIIVALGTDALADVDDALPDPDSSDRAGWWGDMDAGVLWNGWPIGSKLWLLQRAKIESVEGPNGSTLARIKNYIIQAIQPFIDRRIATSMDVVVTRLDPQRIDALLRIYRGPLPAIQLRYQVLWDELAGTDSAP